MPTSTVDLRDVSLLVNRRHGKRNRLIDWAMCVLEPAGQAPARHHRLLLEELESVASGVTDRLMVLMPPGSAKSTYTSIVFPAWWFTRHPSSSVITASHTAELAGHFGRQVRGLIDEHGRGLGARLVANDRSARRWRLSTGGQYYAAGLRGSITGRRANLIIIDDPIKSRAEADSAGARDIAWTWYKFDLLTRLVPGGRIILVMTRWHEDDLGGRLLAQNMSEWRILRLPALAEPNDPLERPPGAPLWPEWEDLSNLIRKRETIGERAWSALFQQSPRPREGSLFKADRLITLDVEPDHKPAHLVRAWDLAATSKSDDNDPDWTVGLKLYRDDSGRFVILDIVRERNSPWEIEKAVLDTARRDGPEVLISLPQDPGSAGKFVVSRYLSLLAGYRVTASAETGSKVTRATPVAAQLEGGNLAIVRGDWNFNFIEELRDFPQGRKDDQIDALSRAFAQLTTTSLPARRLNVNFVTR